MCTLIETQISVQFGSRYVFARHSAILSVWLTQVRHLLLDAYDTLLFNDLGADQICFPTESFL